MLEMLMLGGILFWPIVIALFVVAGFFFSETESPFIALVAFLTWFGVWTVFFNLPVPDWKYIAGFLLVYPMCGGAYALFKLKIVAERVKKAKNNFLKDNTIPEFPENMNERDYDKLTLLQNKGSGISQKRFEFFNEMEMYIKKHANARVNVQTEKDSDKLIIKLRNFGHKITTWAVLWPWNIVWTFIDEYVFQIWKYIKNYAESIWANVLD
jgi:hypothetical protein